MSEFQIEHFQLACCRRVETEEIDSCDYSGIRHYRICCVLEGIPSVPGNVRLTGGRRRFMNWRRVHFERYPAAIDDDCRVIVEIERGENVESGTAEVDLAT